MRRESSLTRLITHGRPVRPAIRKEGDRHEQAISGKLFSKVQAPMARLAGIAGGSWTRRLDLGSLVRNAPGRDPRDAGCVRADAATHPGDQLPGAGGQRGVLWRTGPAVSRRDSEFLN